jgi:hypothetical protein
LATTKAAIRSMYEIELDAAPKAFIEAELTPWQKGVMRDLIAELEHAPGRKGLTIRGLKNTRIISRGGFRARYKFDAQKRKVRVESVTAPLASVAGEHYSVWELPKFQAVLRDPRARVPSLTREERWAVIREGIGSRPDLPPGKEYVRRVRPIWGGLIRDRGNG